MKELKTKTQLRNDLYWALGGNDPEDSGSLYRIVEVIQAIIDHLNIPEGDDK